jgi:hypothetical protein
MSPCVAMVTRAYYAAKQGGCQGPCRHAHSVVKPFTAARAHLGASADLRATRGTIRGQLDTATRAGRILLGHRAATLWAQELPTRSAVSIAGVPGRAARGAVARLFLVKAQSTVWAAHHFGRNLRATIWAEKLQLGAAA